MKEKESTRKKFNLKDDEFKLVNEVISALFDELSLGKDCRNFVECPYPISHSQIDAIKYYLRKHHGSLADRVVITSGVPIGDRIGAIINVLER